MKLLSLCIVYLLLTSCAAHRDYFAPKCEVLDSSGIESTINVSSLKYRTSIEGAEKEQLENGINLQSKDEWDELKTSYQKGLDVWYFSEPYETLTGYILIENCAAKKQIILSLKMM
jgi:hypothetical protein